MAELLQTERTYVKDLEVCIKVSDFSIFRGVHNHALI